MGYFRKLLRKVYGRSVIFGSRFSANAVYERRRAKERSNLFSLFACSENQFRVVTAISAYRLRFIISCYDRTSLLSSLYPRRMEIPCGATLNRARPKPSPDAISFRISFFFFYFFIPLLKAFTRYATIECIRFSIFPFNLCWHFHAQALFFNIFSFLCRYVSLLKATKSEQSFSTTPASYSLSRLNDPTSYPLF